MPKIFFKEEQKFNQWWIWILIALCLAIWIWQFVQQILMGKPFGDNPMSDAGVILLGIFPVAVILLFYLLKLETIIDEEGVKCRFSPFQRKFKTFPLSDIMSYDVKKYNPILDYGGWGIRFGRKGKAYNVSGSQGLYLELKNGKNFLIGTLSPDSMRYAMEKLMKNPER